MPQNEIPEREPESSLSRMWRTVSDAASDFKDRLLGAARPNTAEANMPVLAFKHRNTTMRVLFHGASESLRLVATEPEGERFLWKAPVSGNFRVHAADSGNYIALVEAGKGTCRILDVENGAQYKEIPVDITPDEFFCMPSDEFVEVYKAGDPNRRVTYSIETGRVVENVPRAPRPSVGTQE